MYIAIGILIILIIFMIVTKAESVPAGVESSKITAPFYRIGVYLYRRLFEDKERQSAYFQKMYDAKAVLNPSGKTGEEVALFFIKKTGLCFLVIFVGMLFVTINSFNNSTNDYLENGNQIRRQDYDGKEYTVVLNIETEDENIEGYEVEIGERIYTKGQLESMLPEFYDALEGEVLGENESVDFINKDINLVESIDGYPFLIEYRWQDKETINRQGEIGRSVSENGTLVEMETTISYRDFEEKNKFAFRVYPKDYTMAERIEYLIENAIQEESLASQNEEYFTLPDNVEGIKVVWSEDKENHTVVLLLLIIISAVGIYIAMDKDLFKKLDERRDEMEEDYPEIVSKITLLVGAGMTIRGAWKKIAMDYKEKRDKGMKSRYAYEEMLFTLYEMESGVEETICYSHFSQRARVQKYVKLVSLLDQNLKMGSKGLISNLRNESRDAFEDRKSRAEKKGEEAGTKLLLPMVLMLVVVMVVIMVPAFMSM